MGTAVHKFGDGAGQWGASGALPLVWTLIQSYGEGVGEWDLFVNGFRAMGRAGQGRVLSR